MTKVEMRFRLDRPLDEALQARLADIHAVYGMRKVTIAPALDAITVEYDATRMRPADVERVLAGRGLPVRAE